MRSFKSLFVEEVSQEESQVYFDEFAFADDQSVNTEGVSVDNFIADIYRANNLDNTTRSIFKVEELINSLPKEMPSDTKRTTVLSILASFNLSPEELQQDADARMSLVLNTATKYASEYALDCETASQLIEEKKKEIELLEKEIAAKQNELNSTTELSKVEMERITKLLLFVGGDENGTK